MATQSASPHLQPARGHCEEGGPETQTYTAEHHVAVRIHLGYDIQHGTFTDQKRAKCYSTPKVECSTFSALIARSYLLIESVAMRIALLFHINARLR